MSAIALTVYVLIWPAVVGAVLFIISRAFAREYRESRREGRRMV